MNKIADANIPSIMKRFQYMLDDKSVEIVLEVVLAKCFMHDKYIKCYMTMLEHLHSRFESQVMDRLMSFMESFMVEMDKMEIRSDILTLDDYDAFCLFVKTKKHVYGKHAMLLNMIENGILSPYYEEYFVFIMTFVQQSITKSPHLLEIGANMLVMFFEVFKEAEDKRQAVQELYQDSVAHCNINKKTQFIFMALCDSVDQKLTGIYNS